MQATATTCARTQTARQHGCEMANTTSHTYLGCENHEIEHGSSKAHHSHRLPLGPWPTCVTDIPHDGNTMRVARHDRVVTVQACEAGDVCFDTTTMSRHTSTADSGFVSPPHMSFANADKHSIHQTPTDAQYECWRCLPADGACPLLNTSTSHLQQWTHICREPVQHTTRYCV